VKSDKKEIAVVSQEILDSIFDFVLAMPGVAVTKLTVSASARSVLEIYVFDPAAHDEAEKTYKASPLFIGEGKKKENENG